MLALACLAGALMVVGPASSETRSCRQLEADLASATSPQASRYEGAILTQREQLEIAYGRSRDAGCGFAMSDRGIAKCGRIDAQIEKMERNLEALQRKRARLSESGSEKARARISAALIANGCRDEAVADARPRHGEDSEIRLLDEVISAEVETMEPYEEVPPPEEPEPYPTRQSDIYRIMPPEEGAPPDQYPDQNVFSFPPPLRQVEAVCVRTCDGYLFPMSSGNGFADPSSDQKSCESSCPGAPVEVYYRDEGESDAESLISASSGVSYGELPTAYLFKKTGTPLPPNCSCNRPKTFKVLSSPSRTAVPPSDEASATENAEPAPHTQSGSILTIAPPAQPAAVVPEPTAKSVENVAPDADKKVRVVGPAFLPDPSEAIDLQAPVPHPVR